MKITETYFEGVYVKYDGRDAVIGFSTKPQEARCRFLLSMKKSGGAFELRETPRFKTIGPMLDVSRGKVMTVAGVKRFMDQIQKLGMNMLMLYTEDIFELKDYPQFGYLRGRYSLEELKELDRYAASLGMELIPCIQTFGHLESYLKTPEGNALRDNERVLLAGEEATYAFIEAQLRAIREAFSTQRVHLGMDETYGLGLGNYLAKNGYREPGEIYREHLARVLEISGKYFKKPMIWSDMIFHQNNTNYAIDYDPDPSVIDATPAVDLVYWEYGKESYEFHKHALDQHARFKGGTAFAGGVWTWNGISPNLDFTLKPTKPALEACIDSGVDTVIATMWTSGGSGADYHQALPGLCIFSEYCYKGKDCTEADIYAASKQLTGVDEALFHAISAIYLGRRSASGLSTAFLYGDPLLDFAMGDFDYPEAIAAFRKAQEVIRAHPDYQYQEFFDLLYTIAIGKATLYAGLQPAYKADDREKLAALAAGIPALIGHYRRFYALFKELWQRDYKPFGMESYTHDFGGIILRLEDTADTLQRYLSGSLSTIEELEPERLTGMYKTWRSATSYISYYKK